MMRKKRVWSVIFITLVLFLFLGFISKGNVLAFIDQSFLTGLFFLILAAGIFVVQGGFFSVFLRTFKKFNKLPGRKQEDEDEDDSPLAKEERRAFYQNLQFICLYVGIILILASLLFLFFQ
jgi:fatty acid desaturase